MTTFITGAAGFVGSNFVDRLLGQRQSVVGYDNFSSGQEPFLLNANKDPNFRLIRGDLLSQKELTAAMKDCQRVIHLAANADVRFGSQHPRRDLEQNTIGTFNVLEAMHVHGIRDLAFASTGSVYGEATVFPTPENAPMPIQTSFYSASKLAGEGMISAYVESHGLRAHIFRMVSIVGRRYTHGHIFDFYKQLLENPRSLRVLGDGSQRKSYLAVDDCIDAFQMCFNRQDLVPASSPKGFTQIYNLGTNEFCQVNDSIGWICAALNLEPELHYTGGDRGWVGDNPFIFLDTAKICSLGWKTQSTIREGVEATVAWLQANQWVFSSR